MRKKKWYQPKKGVTSKNKAVRLRYSHDSGIRGWVKNKERLEDACTEKQEGKQGHVYIFSIGHDNLYKIGCTENVENRLKHLRAGNPFLRCVWSAWTKDKNALESEIHYKMRKFHVDREIFKLEQRQISEINNIANQFQA